MTDLRDPLTLAPLTRRAVGVCAVWEGGSRAWPEVDGIPYLRVGRDELADRVVARVEAGDEAAARAELLRDQDDFARQPPPTMDAALAVSRDEPATFREAMAALEYGPVAHYFAHRTSTPTYLSGLALLAEVEAGDHVLELCCGVGHFLRHIEARDREEAKFDDPEDGDRYRIRAAGVDVVWSKLWLARRYVGIEGVLVCVDVSAGRLPFGDASFHPAFCHDAIYFLPDKRAVLDEMRRVGRSVLVGHAHNRLADHGDVAGTPLSPSEYAALCEGRPAAFYDDARLAEVSRRWSGFEDRPDIFSSETDPSDGHRRLEELDGAEAIAWSEWEPDADRTYVLGDSWHLPPGPLRLNPLLKEQGGRLVPDWPMPRFAEEYAAADYLTGPVPTAEQVAWAERGDWWGDAAMEDFVRRRTFIDLPERW